MIPLLGTLAGGAIDLAKEALKSDNKTANTTAPANATAEATAPANATNSTVKTSSGTTVGANMLTLGVAMAAILAIHF